MCKHPHNTTGTVALLTGVMMLESKRLTSGITRLPPASDIISRLISFSATATAAAPATTAAAAPAVAVFLVILYHEHKAAAILIPAPSQWALQVQLCWGSLYMLILTSEGYIKPGP